MHGRSLKTARQCFHLTINLATGRRNIYKSVSFISSCKKNIYKYEGRSEEFILKRLRLELKQNEGRKIKISMLRSIADRLKSVYVYI